MSQPQFFSEKPKFAERGVTLSASTVKYSEEWMYALLDSMAQMRLNSLLWEVKVASTDTEIFPVTNEPFITPVEAKRIVAYARERGIEVIPEINAPGHLRTWLTHYPQYAIQLSTGDLDLERIDATNPQAVEWYLQLVDSYAEVFDSPWWHMGADEFENQLDHRTYADYPQLAEAARERWGAAAQPWDINTNFVNQVNAHLKSRGKRLRVWNDGMRREGMIRLDSDIVVEYWLDRKEASYTPAEIGAAGHEMVNVPQYLYFSRSEKQIYDPQPAEIYTGPRGMLDLFDGDQVGPQAFGIRLSLWPDRDWMQTPGEVLREARDVLILVGQVAWDGAQAHAKWPTWAEFKEYADGIDLPAAPEY